MEIWKMGLWVIVILSFICFWICCIFCNKINKFFFFLNKEKPKYLGSFWLPSDHSWANSDVTWMFSMWVRMLGGALKDRCIKGTLAPFIQGLLHLGGDCCLVAKSCPSLFVTLWKGPKQQNFKTLLTKPSWEHQLIPSMAVVLCCFVPWWGW